MKKLLLVLIILVASGAESDACLNYYYSIDNKGDLHPAKDLKRAFNTNFNLKLLDKKLQKGEAQIKKEADYKLLSDYAVLLLKAGKTKEALAILIQLSRHYPNEYQIAANLGTAYELNGEVEQALQFIKRGIELNPNSHEGSEWVHVKVLEVKLQLEKDNTYLSKNSVLNLTDEDKRDSLVRKQLLIQLRERFPFSPGPDPIMASMLIDLGDCFANTRSIEFAKVLYTMAKLYYGANDELVDPKIDEMVKLRNKFATIKPERNVAQGENVMMSGIRYKSMLDDNNGSNHQIDWKKIVIDTDLLLSHVHLERIEPKEEEIEPETTEMEADVVDSIKEKSTPKEGVSHRLKLLLLGGFILIMLGFLIYKRRNTKKN